MKKAIISSLIICSSIGAAFAQKTNYTTTAYSEKNGGSFTVEESVKLDIVIDKNGGYIEVGSSDPQIFRITETKPTTTQSGETITEFICSDNEAADCKVQLIQNGGKSKLLFIYADLEYYYCL